MKTFKCFDCRGTGRWADYDHCEICGGRGVRPMSERFESHDGYIWDAMKAEHAQHCPCGCHARDAVKLASYSHAQEVR